MFLMNQFRLTGAIFLALALVSCDKANEKALQESNLDSSFPAVISGSRYSDLKIRTGGYPVKYFVEKGERVASGDLIARLDNPELEKNLAGAKSRVYLAEADIEAAMQRAKAGTEGRSIEEAKANLNSDRGYLMRIEGEIAESELRAPFDGLVVTKYVNDMQKVSLGQNVISLMRLDKLQASIDVPANLLENTNLADPDKGKYHLQASVVFDAAPNQIVEAEFKGASTSTSNDSKIYRLSFEFEPPKELAVVPGMEATVALHIEEN